MHTEREEWEGEVFDNLEEMSNEHRGEKPAPANAPGDQAEHCDERALATGLRQMPAMTDDDDGWCPRLA
jgi:hypothetical protein